MGKQNESGEMGSMLLLLVYIFLLRPFQNAQRNVYLIGGILVVDLTSFQVLPNLKSVPYGLFHVPTVAADWILLYLSFASGATYSYLRSLNYDNFWLGWFPFLSFLGCLGVLFDIFSYYAGFNQVTDNILTLLSFAFFYTLFSIPKSEKAKNIEKRHKKIVDEVRAHNAEEIISRPFRLPSWRVRVGLGALLPGAFLNLFVVIGSLSYHDDLLSTIIFAVFFFVCAVGCVILLLPKKR